MGKRIARILDIDGAYRENPDFPVAVVREHEPGDPTGTICDPIFNDKVTRNLYGRIMTLVEATTEPARLKAVKDVFSKELKSWEDDVYKSAFHIAEHNPSSSKIY